VPVRIVFDSWLQSRTILRESLSSIVRSERGGPFLLPDDAPKQDHEIMILLSFFDELQRLAYGTLVAISEASAGLLLSRGRPPQGSLAPDIDDHHASPAADPRDTPLAEAGADRNGRRKVEELGFQLHGVTTTSMALEIRAVKFGI
jgi:hypothetical protein